MKTEIIAQLNKFRSKDKIATIPHIVSERIQRSVAAFHQSLPGYAPTPLANLPNLASWLGIENLWIKDEALRLDLNAYKVLGASYAVARVLAQKLGLDGPSITFTALRSQASKFHEITFVTATDGNHGRAVAWAAHELGCRAVVYMPQGSAEVRLEAVRELGADAATIDGNYDDAVRLAAKHARERGWILLQDTSWKGYEEIPIYIMQGYATLLTETFDQLGAQRPTHIFVQTGGGSLAAGLLAFLGHTFGEERPFFTVVESMQADCYFQSANTGNGRPVIVSGDLDTIMAGLACGEPSAIGWQILKAHADAFAACSDEVTRRGMRLLGNPLKGDDRVISGESGAVTAGLVFALLHNPKYKRMAQMLHLTNASKILLFSTEGDTDPAHYREVVW